MIRRRRTDTEYSNSVPVTHCLSLNRGKVLRDEFTSRLTAGPNMTRHWVQNGSDPLEAPMLPSKLTYTVTSVRGATSLALTDLRHDRLVRAARQRRYATPVKLGGCGSHGYSIVIIAGHLCAICAAVT
jgi:hypothetical protein